MRRNAEPANDTAEREQRPTHSKDDVDADKLRKVSCQRDGQQAHAIHRRLKYRLHPAHQHARRCLHQQRTRANFDSSLWNAHHENDDKRCHDPGL